MASSMKRTATFALLDNHDGEVDKDVSPGYDPNKYTIAWVCALGTELTAAKAMLDDPHYHPPYTLGSVHGHDVVVACLCKGKTGNNAAAVTASELAHEFRSLRFVFMIGVAGGVPSGKSDVRLGDVVVGIPGGLHPGVVQWDMGKLAQGGRLRTGALDNPPKPVLEALEELASQYDMRGSEIDHYLVQSTIRYPDLAARYATAELIDIIFPPETLHIDNSPSGAPIDTDCEGCQTHGIRHREHNRGRRVHFGLVASGNMVIKDARQRDEICKRLKEEVVDEVLCFEMETAGVLTAFPCLAIRGICDYADAHKNKSWQPYAAAVAAAYAKELLALLPPASVTNMSYALGKYSFHFFVPLIRYFCPRTKLYYVPLLFFFRFFHTHVCVLLPY